MSHCWRQEKHPAKIVAVCLGTLVGTSQPLNKAVNDVKFGQILTFSAVSRKKHSSNCVVLASVSSSAIITV